MVCIVVEEKVAALIEALDLANRAYFAKDRQKVIKEHIDSAIVLLDSKPVEGVGKFQISWRQLTHSNFTDLSKKDKAHLHYLRGKILDFQPEYTKQAEENLSKAIKLVPTKREAWDALGHVYWKKNALVESRKCFEGSLEHEENNIETLRSLSMVCRQIQETEEKKRKENFALSI